MLHLVRKGAKHATMPLTVPVQRVLEACGAIGPRGRWCCGRSRANRSTAATATAWSPGSRRPPVSLATSARTRCVTITNALNAGVPLRDAQILARHADPRTTEHYDRARGNLDRHGVHFLTAYVAGV